MHYRFKALSLATATLLLSLTSPFLPLSLNLEPLVVQAQTTQDRNTEAMRLYEEGRQLLNRGQFREALEKFQEALVIVREIGVRQGEWLILSNIGAVYNGLGQYPKALEFYQQALAISREIGDQTGQRIPLNGIGEVYDNQGQYLKALEFYQQALAIVREISDRAGEGIILNSIGGVYGNLGQYPKALEFYQQALAIVREIANKAGEGTILNNIGGIYDNLGQYPKALEFYQQALAINSEIGNKMGEGASLSDMGLVYHHLGQYPKALEFYEQALAIRTQIGDKAGQGTTLNSIGAVYRNLGQYPKALEFYEQALAIRTQIGDKAGQGTTLSNIGVVYDNLGQYPKALQFYQQALTIHTQIGDKAGQGTTLNNIGVVYVSLGQYLKAVEFSQQALAIRTQIGDKAGQAQTLNNIGAVYISLGQDAKALEFYQQALAIQTEIGYRAAQGTTLNNIGEVYRNLGQYPKALEFSQQALAIHIEIGNQAAEGEALNNIGAVYGNLGQYSKALEFSQQALAIIREIGDKALEGTKLSNIGFLLEAQNQPELAIVFYKQSVNVREEIRKDLRVLPKEQQQSFTETVAHTYRRLADLLLKQDRVLEAQRVLDLLKVQELEDYLRNVRGNEQTQQGVEYLPSEQQLLTQYNAKLTQVVQLGKELNELQKIPASDRTQEQEQRRREIEAAQRELTQEYLNFIRSPQIAALVQQLTRTTGDETLNPELLRGLQDNLKKLGQDAVLLYPLILEDRLELILVTPYAPPIRRPVPVKREELNRAIAEFRSTLTEPRKRLSLKPAQTAGQQLYNWLIQPIEAALQEANTKTIIYAPDGQLRYIPLAALYDGNQWLVQKYRINNITALSLTHFDQQPQALKILAGAFSQGNYSFQVGDRTFNFGGLPYAGQEVENLAATLPSTTQLLNQDFSENETLARMSDYSILHLATHAAFVTGKPEDSFILFGNGDRATLLDVETWPLTNTDLVVLSACETAVGGQLGNGEEILGFGYLMQQAGARAAIASLWSVDDGGTQVLMNAFYTAVENGMSKAEALRQAQIALITKDLSAVGGSRGEEAWIEVVSTRTGLPPQVSNHLNHPYYWAPFILIGNGL